MEEFRRGEPAVTLPNSTIQSGRNERVRTAFAAETSAVVTSGFSRTVAGSHPSGRQPARGTRMLTTPNIMITKYATPRVRKSAVSAPPSATEVATAGS